ncbi:MAG TPA: bifunctional hydroxymethylpyrimidine kinase/phosphomethylpyrimidine kinase, partial [Clostridiales bacterium]|nr:bifunctional hydroxymethylpyrimidine kinase/phosphomethylpyrimidine kinase [Clostridiales bacterium]
AGIGCKEVALTGISFEKGQLGTMAYRAETDTFFEYYNEQEPVSFHGTGDVFAASLLGAKESGLSTENALKVAVDYTLACIKETMADENANWYGVNFESAIPVYLDLLRKRK